MMILVKIGKIDMNGFLGRDYHPDPEDEGKTATLISCEQFTFDKGTPDESTFSFFTCALEGRKVELVDFEIVSIHGVN